MKPTELARPVGNDLRDGMANIEKVLPVSVSHCRPEREDSKTFSNSIRTLAYT